MIKKEPLVSPLLKLFMATMIFANISSRMSFGYLALYLADLGAGIRDIGMVFTVSALVPLLLQIVGGWLSDSIGRLKTIAIGSVAGVIGGIGLWLAPSWEWVIVALSIGTIASSMVRPSFSSFIADQTPEENRGKVFGITQSLYQIVGVVGPLLGAFLAQKYNYKFMYFIALILYSGAAIIRIWMAATIKINIEKNEKLTIKSFKRSIKTLVGLIVSGGIVTWIFITDGIVDVAYRLSGELSSIYQLEFGGLVLQQIGLLTAIQSIVIMVLNVPSGWLSDKFGERVGISLGSIFFSIATLSYLPATEFWQYVLAWILFGIAASLIKPAYQSLISKAFPEKMRGTAFGFFHSTIGILSLPAPLIGAHLWERYSAQTPFLVTAYAAFVIGVLSWFKLKLPPNNNDQNNSSFEAGD